jgi:ATP-dependent Clp protease ATP-binding subunit ClpA
MPMAYETHLEAALEAKLKRLHLRLELAGQGTLVLKNVPADHRSFSKARTNLLIKRPTESLPCVVCVDEDLEYTGTDPALAGAFAAGPTQQGWRVLTFGGCLHRDLTAALEYALSFLVADKIDDEPGKTSAAAAAAPSKGLLAAWAENLTDAVAGGQTGPTLCRDEEMEQVTACTLRWLGHLALILGEAGTGKTNLLHGAASLLARRGRKVLAVNTGAIMAGTLFESEREALLMSLLREARDSGAVLALEQAEWAVIGVPRGLVLLRESLDRGVRLMATSSADHVCRFAIHPLASRLEIVQLGELCAGDTCRVLETLRPSIATHHGVQIDAEVEHAVVERALPMEGSLPGKAVGLLDAAAARASLTGNVAVSLIDVYLAACRMLGERA